MGEREVLLCACLGSTAGVAARRFAVCKGKPVSELMSKYFPPQKVSRRKALRAAMMEEFRVAEEGREANVRLNQLSQEEVNDAKDT